MKLAPGLALLLVAACGEDDPARCEPPQGPLPLEGAFADPLVLPLPETCVPGGLVDLPGRWFVVDSTKSFTFAYPQFEGDCTRGFKRSFHVAEDHDLADGFTFHTWSDGTRLYNRTHYRYGGGEPQPTFDIVQAFAACMLPDGTLAAVQARFDTDNGERFSAMTGTRFGREDDLASGIALVGELGTWGADQDITAYNLVIDGTHAYVVGATGFEVIDVANPAAPVHVGHLDGRYNDVRVVHGNGKLVAFLAPIGDANTAIVDVTNPATPTKTGELPEYAHSLQVVPRGAQTLLYLATYTAAIPQYDVTDPLAPVRLGEATVPGPESDGVHDLFVDGDRIYANYTTGGTVALDVAGGLANAVEIGRAPSSYSHASWAGTTGGRPVVLHGDEGMTRTDAGGAHLRILDGDPASATFMQDVAKYQTRPEVGIHNFEVVGDKVYIAYYQDGVRVVDLANPAQPREVAHYNTWDPATAFGGPFEGAIGIRVVADRIYVADTERGLLIFEAR